MTEDDVLQIVETLLALEPTSIAPEARLVEIGWDSLTVLEFVATVDKEYGLGVDSEKISRAATPAELFATIIPLRRN